MNIISSIPGVYEAEDSGSVHKSELKSDEKLKSSPSVHSLPVLNSVPPLDYRQLLLEKRRNSLKNSWYVSFASFKQYFFRLRKFLEQFKFYCVTCRLNFDWMFENATKIFPGMM